MSVLPQDETGKAELSYDYDFDALKVACYVDDGAGGIKIWDGTADFGGDVEVDTDALEALVAAGNVILGNILTLKQDEQTEYKLADWDASGDPIYVGKTDKAENWIITEYNIANGTARYISGSGSYATNWTGRAGLSYDPYYTEF